MAPQIWVSYSKGWCLESLIGLLSIHTQMSLTHCFANVLSGADIETNTGATKKFWDNPSNVTSPLWMPWLSYHRRPGCSCGCYPWQSLNRSFGLLPCRCASAQGGWCGMGLHPCGGDLGRRLAGRRVRDFLFDEGPLSRDESPFEATPGLWLASTRILCP